MIISYVKGRCIHNYLLSIADWDWRYLFLQFTDFLVYWYEIFRFRFSQVPLKIYDTMKICNMHAFSIIMNRTEMWKVYEKHCPLCTVYDFHFSLTVANPQQVFTWNKAFWRLRYWSSASLLVFVYTYWRAFLTFVITSVSSIVSVILSTVSVHSLS